MSQLRVTTLNNASNATGTPNLTLDASGNATVGNTLVMGSSFKRNKIINGDMRVDQRNAGVAQINITSPVYICDRFSFATSQNSKWSVQQLSVTDLVGFTKSAYVTISTTYTTGAADFALVDQKIEGLNVADLGWGAAGAQTVTLSFKVKTNVTGTYAVTVLNGGATRAYNTTYTISSPSSGAWQTVTLTIPGDTTGTWATDNTTGIWLRFSLGAGSNYPIASPNTWGTAIGYQPSGGAIVSGNTGGYWQITGVQLEVGSVATPYERQIYSEQLAQCQRYYFQLNGSTVNNTVGPLAGYSSGGTSATFTIFTPSILRSTPSITVGSANLNYFFSTSANTSSSTSISVNNLYQNTLYLALAGFTSIGDGAVGMTSIRNTLSISAEL